MVPFCPKEIVDLASRFAGAETFDAVRIAELVECLSFVGLFLLKIEL
jgi:hypothetical protein